VYAENQVTMQSKSQPIIVVKRKGSHGGHHGGAWKVAYADFVTALMSLFIVLWLMNQSDQVKKAVAGYFNDPKGTAGLLGTTMSGNGTPVAENQNALEKLKEKLEQQIKAKKELEKLSKQIEIAITPEGLRIELLEDQNGTFYESGSAQLSASGQELLVLLAGELRTLPNSLLIEGHTDAAKYSTDNSYSNWELSADRANSARRLLQQSGVRTDQVTQVRGYADQFLRVKDNPYDPSNRRISILVKNAGSDVAAALHKATAVSEGTSSDTENKAEPEVKGGQAKTVTEEGGKPVSDSRASKLPKTSNLMGKLTAMLPGKKN
jgi:Flagellar motor protein